MPTAVFNSAAFLLYGAENWRIPLANWVFLLGQTVADLPVAVAIRKVVLF